MDWKQKLTSRKYWKKITFEIIKYIVIAAIGAGVGIIIKGA